MQDVYLQQYLKQLTEFDINHSINGLFTIYHMPKNTVNFNSTNKESNWSIETESCEGTSRSSNQAAAYFI